MVAFHPDICSRRFILIAKARQESNYKIWWIWVKNSNYCLSLFRASFFCGAEMNIISKSLFRLLSIEKDLKNIEDTLFKITKTAFGLQLHLSAYNNSSSNNICIKGQDQLPQPFKIDFLLDPSFTKGSLWTPVYMKICSMINLVLKQFN